MKKTVEIADSTTTVMDKTLYIDHGKDAEEMDLEDLRSSLGVKQYSDIGFYGETSVLGKGGVGIVLKGHDSNLGRDVAVKIIKPSMRGETHAIERFIREARATAQVEHPNIVPVHEMGVNPEWGLYFTMKKLAGEDLSKILSKLKTGDPVICEKYSLSRLVHIFTDVCNGVAYAHSKGVMHRDLKPENIFVGEFGEVLIIDWGLVRKIDINDDDLLDSAGRKIVDIDIDSAVDPNLTLDGQISGTPYYMSPEQIKGDNDKLDHRSDIYTLGVILYQMLTLRLPFEGGSVSELVKRVSSGEFTPPRKVAKGRKIPLELDAICLKAMSYHPENRYRNVGALLKDVFNYLDDYPVSAMRYSLLSVFGKLCRRHKVVTSVLFAIVLTSTTGVFLHRMNSYIKYDVLYDSANKHIAKSIEELRNAENLLAESNKMRQGSQTPADERGCDMLDTQCLAAEKKAEESAKFALAMLEGIPEKFKNSPKVKQARLQLLRTQIAYNKKKGNTAKVDELFAQLASIITSDSTISDAERKREIDALRKLKTGHP